MYGITHVHEGIHVGGDPEFSADLDSDIKALNGMHLVIDVRGGKEGPGWERIIDGPEVVKVVMYDDGRRSNRTEMFVSVLDAVFTTAAEADIEPEALQVFVHCHMGVNRSPSVVMYLLMVLHRMDPMTAFMKVREMRTCAGLAYATAAIRAHQGRVFSGWDEFETAYWEIPGHTDSVNGFIRQNRAIESGRSWVDAKGMVHVTGKG